ncbi:hypothetical protein JCM3775_005284 [Rhodotorula graminis]
MDQQLGSSTSADQHASARTRALVQQLPVDVVALIAYFATSDDGLYTHESADDLRRDATSFARVCRAWRAAGTAAVWREIHLKPDLAPTAMQRHVEAHRHLFVHVKSAVIVGDTRQGYGWRPGPDNMATTSCAVLAACPNLVRLEVRGEYEPPGPFLRALEASIDLTKLENVFLYFPNHDRPTQARDFGVPIVSPIVVFRFLRACKRLQYFFYWGWAEAVSDPVSMPLDRRIKVQTLRLNISSAARNPFDLEAHHHRMRFLMQFDLARLVKFRAHVHLGRDEWWVALRRMVNLEHLALVEEFGFEHGGIDELATYLVGCLHLRRFELYSTRESQVLPDAPSTATHAQLQRLLDSIPHSVTHLVLQLPFPVPMVGSFADVRLEGALRVMSVCHYDPIELSPTVSSSLYHHPDEDRFDVDLDDFPFYF